jgi:hypothetical protein
VPQPGIFVNCIQVAYASNRIWTGSWPLLRRWKAKDKNEGEKGPVVSDTQIKVPTLEEIELRAYEIYLKRGDTDGIALEDWLVPTTVSTCLSAHSLFRYRRGFPHAQFAGNCAIDL